MSELNKLIQYSKEYYYRGWMVATAGNLSLLNRKKKQICITSSGKHKGKLKQSDFIYLDLDSLQSLKKTLNKPSAETSIHQVIYQNIPNANVVLHVHTVSSCKLKFGLKKENSVIRYPLPNIELLKAFGNFSENPNLKMIVTYNHGSVPNISKDFEKEIQDAPSDVPFFIIENHGITVWGSTVEEANKNLEAVDFILQVMS
jgi:methylthioribulose-1-phosphate dehydratase